MHEKSLTTLEFPAILNRVAYHCAFSASRELVLELLPSDDREIVQHRQTLTTEARHLLDHYPDVGVRAARDVRPQIVRAERGAVLQPDDLIAIQNTLRSAAYVKSLFNKLGNEHYPQLYNLVRDLPVRPNIDRHIEQSISEEGSVLDSASAHLREVRVQLRIAQQRLQERLGSLVNEYHGALQEHLITMRDGRYVLPVRAESKGQVKGIVHDQSASGATVFIEPLVVVEMNNRIRELQLEERREIERILQELSKEVGVDAPYCRLQVDIIADLDVQLAKGRYSQEVHGNPPKLNVQGILRLIAARHPLLKGKVVPLDFHLGEEFSMVLITGPNTGGKTVALKTVGLLAIMTAAGLHIPADDRSEMPIFHNIFADIGDEQSIEQNLSTFSSHMTRIIDILHQAESRSLVLFDELGAGTDPSEGSALARAILLTLGERGVSCVATTHYSELKAFAHEQKGVVNASVEFDVETLSPTYRLTIGLPGRSNALAIANRLGLDDAIVERARGMGDIASATMENLLSEIQSERKLIADERFHTSMERGAVELEREVLQKRIAELEREKREIERDRVRQLNEARAEGRKLLHDLRSEMGRIRATSQGSELTTEQLDQLRKRMRMVEQRTEEVAEPIVPEIQDTPKPETDEDNVVVPGAPDVGDVVRIMTLGQVGELLSLPDTRGESEVRVGSMKLRVRYDQLQRMNPRKGRSELRRVSAFSTIMNRPAPPLELDLRGMHVEETLPEVEQYIDDAFLSGLPYVRLIHGKGTGALRQSIRELLRHNPHVKSLATPDARMGGEGVTEVTLNS